MLKLTCLLIFYLFSPISKHPWNEHLMSQDLVKPTFQLELDIERCDNSSYSSFYHRMKCKHSPESYLSYKMSLQQKRTLCNVRLHADRLPFLSLYINHTSYKFNPTERCPLCGKDNDDLFHAMALCMHYNCIRPAAFTGIRLVYILIKCFDLMIQTLSK